MWHTIAAVVQDIQAGSWMQKLCWGALGLASCWSLGWLGGLSVHSILKMNSAEPVPIVSNGKDSATSAIRLYDEKWKFSNSERMWTNSKPTTNGSASQTVDGKP